MKLNKRVFAVPAIVLTLIATAVLPQAIARTADSNKPEQALMVTDGTISEINIVDDDQIIRVKSGGEDSGEFDFIIGESTVLLDNDGFVESSVFKKGDKVTAYYLMPQRMSKQYPPQVQTEVLIRFKPESIQNVTVGLYEKDMLMSDQLAASGGLVLHTNEDTQIRDVNNTPFMGLLDGKVLAVFSTIRATSMPAQTTPAKIVVLNIDKSQLILAEPPAPTPAPTPEPAPVLTADNVSMMKFEVNGKGIAAPSAFVSENNVVMVPLRALAEGLGYTVYWDETLSEIRLGKAIALKIGQDSYLVGRMAPIALGAVPVIKDDLTFVPISFFEKVVHADPKVTDNSFQFTYKTQS